VGKKKNNDEYIHSEVFEVTICTITGNQHIHRYLIKEGMEYKMNADR
jgi:hypothetical protein